VSLSAENDVIQIPGFRFFAFCTLESEVRRNRLTDATANYADPSALCG